MKNTISNLLKENFYCSPRLVAAVFVIFASAESAGRTTPTPPGYSNIQIGRVAVAESPPAVRDSNQLKYTSTEIIESIRTSEKKIRDVQAHVKWYEPKTKNLLLVFDWGWQPPMVFIEGEQWSGPDKGQPTARIKYAFDGKAQRNFRHNIGENRTTGGVFQLTPRTFTVIMTPNTLMGHSITQSELRTFGEILSEANDLHVRSQSEQIAGRTCVVLEAIGMLDNASTYDVRAWIDTHRDFRPLKIERYSCPQDPCYPCQPWQALRIRVDNIELKQIDGVWFPIRGDHHYFGGKWLPPDEMTKEQFEKAFSHLPQTEQRKKLKYVAEEKYLRRIDVNNVRINQGIEPEKSTVKFPEGCRVWDDLRKVGYTVKAGQTASQLEEIIAQARRQAEIRQAKDPLIGKPAPPFPTDATWLNSEPLTWKDLRGKVVILDFWADWCGPCRRDLPLMSALHKNRQQTGITVIGLHTPGSRIESIRRLMKQYELDYPICIDVPPPPGVRAAGVMSGQYGVTGIPYAFVIDPNGNITAHSWGASQVLNTAQQLTKK
jgi:thiol-disulfide isomerase/thioredoxin